MCNACMSSFTDSIHSLNVYKVNNLRLLFGGLSAGGVKPPGQARGIVAAATGTRVLFYTNVITTMLTPWLVKLFLLPNDNHLIDIVFF